MKICILGSEGTLGSAFTRVLRDFSFENNKVQLLIFSDRIKDSEGALEVFLKSSKPDILINCIGRVGGVFENVAVPFDLVCENAFTTTIIAQAAKKAEIQNYVYFAPSCIYPASMETSFENMVWGGKPEITSLPYASAKLMGIEMVQAANEQLGFKWRVYIPTNLFGPFDWNHGDKGHVISMLSRKIIQAKKSNSQIVNVWGTGDAVRDFLLTDDFVEFVLYDLLGRNFARESFLKNVPGYGPISIRDLVTLLSKLLNFNGKIQFDQTYPEGSKRKVLSTQFNNIDYKFRNNLESALEIYLEKFVSNC